MYTEKIQVMYMYGILHCLSPDVYSRSVLLNINNILFITIVKCFLSSSILIFCCSEMHLKIYYILHTWAIQDFSPFSFLKTVVCKKRN